MRIVISGHTGFVGGHLLRNINLNFSNCNLILLNKEDFLSHNFNDKIKKEDFIFHLAGVNRAETNEQVYSSNIKINISLLNHLEKINFKGDYIFHLHSKKSRTPNTGKLKSRQEKILIFF